MPLKRRLKFNLTALKAVRGETPIFLLKLPKMSKNELFKHFIEERLTQTPIKIVGAVERHREGGRRKIGYQKRYIYTHNQRTKFLGL